MFSKEQKKEAYNKLPLEIKDLLVSPQTIDLVSEALENAGITGRSSYEADSEILFSLYGLQTLDKAIENIAQISGKEINKLDNLKQSIQKNILDKYSVDINILIKSNEDITHRKTSVPEIAPEIHPMIEEGEKAHDVVPQPAPVVQVEKVEMRKQEAENTHQEVEVPNEESEIKVKPNLEFKNSGYPAGQDPYREPI